MLHGQTRYNLRGRFFDELPEECLKWLTPKLPAPGALGGFSRAWGQGYASNSGAAPAYSTGASGTLGTAIARKEEPAHGLKVNQKVFHAKFGEGTVLTLEGSGTDARAQINFPRHGVKWLALSVAKLTPL
jgi:DNA helicase-2/ATP-dependent DNA helicase PcrA